MTDLSGYTEAEPLRALIEDAHQLQELTQHPGWTVLLRIAGHDIEGWQDRMNSGKFKSLDEYKFCAGWLDGARQLLRVPQAVTRRLKAAQEAEDELKAELENAVDPGPRAEYPEPIYEGASQ